MAKFYGSNVPSEKWESVNLDNSLELLIPTDWEKFIDDSDIDAVFNFAVFSPILSITDAYRENVYISIHKGRETDEDTFLENYTNIFSNTVDNFELIDSEENVSLLENYNTITITYKYDSEVKNNGEPYVIKLIAKSYVVIDSDATNIITITTNSFESEHQSFKPIFNQIIDSLVKTETAIEDNDIENDYESYFSSDSLKLYRSKGIEYLSTKDKLIPLDNVNSVFSKSDSLLNTLFGAGILVVIGYLIMSKTSLFLIGLPIFLLGAWMIKRHYDKRDFQNINFDYGSEGKTEFVPLVKKDDIKNCLSKLKELKPSIKILAPEFNYYY